MSSDTTDHAVTSSLLAAYQILSDRRIAYDTMSWQTPALSFTAQAFLFTIALGSAISPTSRLLAATLALAVSLVSIQLLKKHQHMEYMDALLLERTEVILDLASHLQLNAPPHSKASERRLSLASAGQAVSMKSLPDEGSEAVWGSLSGVKAGFMEKADSPRLWTLALSLFGLVATGVIVTVLLAPELLQ